MSEFWVLAMCSWYLGFRHTSAWVFLRTPAARFRLELCSRVTITVTITLIIAIPLVDQDRQGGGPGLQEGSLEVQAVVHRDPHLLTVMPQQCDEGGTMVSQWC